ncbi:MAG: hypothetical protein KDC38_18895 [Planctomycetes bacterium]|nr:hypothetical protein [Planctomycetota bacterium]
MSRAPWDTRPWSAALWMACICAMSMEVGAQEVVSRSFTVWNRGFPDPNLTRVVSRSFTVLNVAGDCNANGFRDVAEIEDDPALDTNSNGVIDDCELFIRGDANQDNTVNLADVLPLLCYLFASDDCAPNRQLCVETLDVDGTGGISISDAFLLLTHLFLGGPEPAAPYPDCGLEPSGGSFLGCSVYSCP